MNVKRKCGGNVNGSNFQNGLCNYTEHCFTNTLTTKHRRTEHGHWPKAQKLTCLKLMRIQFITTSKVL